MQTLIKAKTMQIESIYSLVKGELEQSEQLVSDSLQSPIELINDLSRHIIQSGGKRIRPLLVLLCAKAFGYQGDLHIRLAAIVELIHTATLLHDDVIDASTLRRGQNTANSVWGNQASVLVGDYLYSHAFQLMVGMDNMLVMEILARSTNTIVQGEILQLQHSYHAKTSEEVYLEIIRCKTGKLFQASAELGAVIASIDETDYEAIGTFGLQLGVAFQLIDDALDYHSNPEKVGKNIGDDLAEGKTTLPLIYALQNCNAQEAKLIQSSVEAGDCSHLPEILRIIETTQAMTYTFSLAQQTIANAIIALEKIPSSIYRDALKSLAEFVVNRQY